MSSSWIGRGWAAGAVSVGAAALLALALSAGCGDSGTQTDGGADATASCGASGTLCGGSCVSTQTDNANCGACGTACASGEVCSQGKCGTSCGGGTKLCGSSCADTKFDPNNCGGCGTKCSSGQVCSGGACGTTCGTGQTFCGGDGGTAYCANEKTDNANCGGCGVVCGTGEVCDDGACSSSCGGDDGGAETLCSPDGGTAYCANTAADNANCGGCGIACGTGRVCQAGACVNACASSDGGVQTLCAPDGGSPYCADLQNAPTDCGACGNVCGAGNACVGGKCTPAGLLGTGTSPDPYHSLPLDSSCKSYLADYGATLAVSGYYTVNPSGTPFEVYCDQTDFSGGWTRCLSFTNTSADDFGTNNDWFDACVDYSNASWAGTDVMIDLVDTNDAALYSAYGTRVGTWTYDDVTSTAAAASQFDAANHDRLITLSTTDTLMIAGKSSANAGCGGSMGNGYGIVLYPATPNYYSNPMMFVMSYQQQVTYFGARSFLPAWTATNEITWNGGATFNSCNFTPPGTPAGTLGTFSFFVR